MLKNWTKCCYFFKLVKRGNEVFWSYENNTNITNYFFNKNHLAIILISLVIIIFFSMYASRQGLGFQKKFVFFSTLILLVLEALRIFWQYKYLIYNGEAVNFLSVTRLDFFTLTLWISIPILLIDSMVVGKRRNMFGLNFVFFITNLFAIISLIYPIGLDANFEFYQFINLDFVLIRSLLIMISFTIILSKWATVDKFLDLYKGLISLVICGIVCTVICIILRDNSNLFYISYCPVFEELGISLSFPFNYLAMGMFLFLFQILLCLPFVVSEKIRQRRA